MSMWLDTQYIGTLSVRLDKFTRKGDYTYNFRCPICGDSQTSRSKARGYAFAKKGGLFYKCHNCQASMSLGNLIKAVDPNLYKQYCLDRYKEGDTGHKPHKEHGFVFKPVLFESSRKDNAFKGLLTPITKLADDHDAVVYVRDRKIPANRHSELYYVQDEQTLKEFAPGYEEKIKGNEPRLVLAFFNKDDELVGLSGRAIRPNKIRYLSMRIKDEEKLIYNANNVDESQPIYVTEGPIDSLFLPNAIAVGSSNLQAAGDVFDKSKLVLVYDNEPRNKEVMREVKDAIENGFRVVIWPKSMTEKDINDMVKNANLTPAEVLDTINKNTFYGAKALLEFNLWRVA